MRGFAPVIGLALAAASGPLVASIDYKIFDPARAGVEADVIIPNSPNPGGDAVTIDVTVVYSTRFRQQLEARGDYIADYILRSFDEVNRYFSNTGLRTRVEVTGLLEWNLPTGSDLIDDHQRLIGFMETQTANRDAFAADLVQLWEVPESGIDDPAFCGWAQTIGPERVISTNGFGYTAVAQGRPGTAFAGCYAGATPAQFARIVAHELGHNLGSTHAWGEGSGQGAFEFAHGKLCGAPLNSFPVGTLMTVSGYALDFFSTPLRFEDGESCGVPEGQPNPADNRETFTRTASFIADLRDASAGLNTVSAVVPSDIGEQNGSLPIALARNNVLGTARLELLVFGESAVNGQDFTAPPSQIVSFASGQAVVTVQIPLVADSQAEGAESLLIFLQRPENFAILGERAFRVDIQDGLISGVLDFINDGLDLLPAPSAGSPDTSSPPPPADDGASSGGGGGGGGGGVGLATLLVLLTKRRCPCRSGFSRERSFARRSGNSL